MFCNLLNETIKIKRRKANEKSCYDPAGGAGYSGRSGSVHSADWTAVWRCGIYPGKSLAGDHHRIARWADLVGCYCSLKLRGPTRASLLYFACFTTNIMKKELTKMK